jgi:probable phosphoglycerate mutase
MAQPYPHKIIFVRHGETSYNAEARLQGQRDVPLNGKGRQQAAAIGRFLGGHMSAEMLRLDAANAFWASPLARARETMELARAAMGLAPERYQLEARLMELTFGAWEGLTWDAIKADHPAALQARAADKWAFTPPGGESYAALAERLRPWLAERDSDTLVVSHGGVARVFLVILAGVQPAAAASADIWQGRALIFAQGGHRWEG